MLLSILKFRELGDYNCYIHHSQILIIVLLNMARRLSQNLRCNHHLQISLGMELFTTRDWPGHKYSRKEIIMQSCKDVLSKGMLSVANVVLEINLIMKWKPLICLLLLGLLMMMMIRFDLMPSFINI